MSIYVIMVLNTLAWSGAFIAGRIIDPASDPIVTAFLRFLIATILLVASCLLTKKSLQLPSRSMVGLQFILGFIGIFLWTIFFHLGLQMVPASKASVLVTTSPIFITIMAAFFYKERITSVKAAGVFMAIAGTILVISRGDIAGLLAGGFGFGEGILLLCALSWAVFVILGKLALRQISPIVSITWSSIFGTIMLFPAALFTGNLGQCLAYNHNTWAGIVYLGVLGTFLGFSWYYKVVATLGPTRASMISCLVPPCSIVFGILLLNEPANLSLLIGGVVTVLGVFAVNHAVSKPGKARQA